MAWLRSSPMVTGTKSIFSPSATASGQRSNRPAILSGVRSPPAVSNSADVAGTVLGTVKKIESGASRASSSIASTPATSMTLPISWLSQEDRRGSVEQCRLRIGAGRHHRGFDVDVRIDQARRDDAAGGVIDRNTAPYLF